MKINLKTTTGRTTEATFDDNATIGAVKESLREEYDIASLRLCYQGKILEDSKHLIDLGEGAVLFIAGKKASIAKPVVSSAVTPTPEASPSSPTVATTSETTSAQPAEAPSAPASSQQQQPVVAETSTAQQAVAPTQEAPVVPSEPSGPNVDEDLVSGIQAMGFDDRDLIKLALRAAYMNPDRAVDYLCSGMPRATLQRLADDASPQHVAPRAQPSHVAPAHVPTATRPTTALSQAIASIPNFEQVRQVVHANPASLPTFMQQLQQNHPEVFELVQQNPEEFLQLIQNEAAGQQQEPVQAGGTSVQLTPADQQAIQELAELGGGAWDLQAAALVYIAVNKNKEVAAAVLFEHGGLPPQLVQAILDQQGGASLDEDDDDDDDALGDE